MESEIFQNHFFIEFVQTFHFFLNKNPKDSYKLFTNNNTKESNIFSFSKLFVSWKNILNFHCMTKTPIINRFC